MGATAAPTAGAVAARQGHPIPGAKAARAHSPASEAPCSRVAARRMAGK